MLLWLIRVLTRLEVRTRPSLPVRLARELDRKFKEMKPGTYIDPGAPAPFKPTVRVDYGRPTLFGIDRTYADSKTELVVPGGVLTKEMVEEAAMLANRQPPPGLRFDPKSTCAFERNGTMCPSRHRESVCGFGVPV